MYHYKECGLDNVWLENGFLVRETPYGKGVSVIDADQLHTMLALQIAEKKGRITGKELRFLRTMLDLSQAALARMLEVTDQAVSLWERTGKVPKSADAMVRILVLGKLDGNKPIKDFLERITTVERLVNQRIVARENAKKRWTTKITSDDVALA